MMAFRNAAASMGSLMPNVATDASSLPPEAATISTVARVSGMVAPIESTPIASIRRAFARWIASGSMSSNLVS